MQRDNIIPRIKEKYKKEIVPYFLSKEKYKNIFEVPRIEKVAVNVSLGKNIENSKILPKAANIIANITGQKPVITKARKSIAAFKLREGMPIGAKVTLRGDMMYEFIDRLISAAIPRTRDFRGLNPKSFDGKGNYSLGIPEVTIFPEAAAEEESFGLEVSVVTSAKNNEAAAELLEKIGFPFKKSSK